MAGVICIAIPVEHAPAQWLATELDKVSAPYLVMPLLWFGVFAAARRIRGGIGRRLALGGLLAAIGAAILFALAVCIAGATAIGRRRRQRPRTAAAA
jgi:hypothetical protein